MQIPKGEVFFSSWPPSQGRIWTCTTTSVLHSYTAQVKAIPLLPCHPLFVTIRLVPTSGAPRRPVNPPLTRARQARTRASVSTIDSTWCPMSTRVPVDYIDLTLETPTVLNTIDLTQENTPEPSVTSAAALPVISTSTSAHTSGVSFTSTTIDFPPLYLSCDVPPGCCPLCRRHLWARSLLEPPNL